MWAMICGRPDMEHLQLSEITLWSGGPCPIDETTIRGSSKRPKRGQQLCFIQAQNLDFSIDFAYMSEAFALQQPMLTYKVCLDL